MAVAHSGNDKERVFNIANPNADPLNNKAVFEWLRRWLQ